MYLLDKCIEINGELLALRIDVPHYCNTLYKRESSAPSVCVCARACVRFAYACVFMLSSRRKVYIIIHRKLGYQKRFLTPAPPPPKFLS